MAEAFAWEPIQFRTLEQFEHFLSLRTKPAWFEDIIIHHTAIPTTDQWRGAASMTGMRNWWRDNNGWTAGPQVIVAPDGIWQATPVTQRGIHAGECNATSIGVEVVGNYNTSYWQEPIKSYALGALVALARWGRIDGAALVKQKRLKGHKECMYPRDCPGNAIDLNKLRSDVATLIDLRATKTDYTVLGVRPSITLDQFGKYVALAGGVNMTAAELERVYTVASWLELDPAFLLAVARETSGVGLLNNPLQEQTNCPINITAVIGETRPTVKYGNTLYYKYQSAQLGFLASILHIKNIYGTLNRVTVRSILASLLPPANSTTSDLIANRIMERMIAMRAL